MKIVKFTDKQLKDLNVFLQRVPMKGEEAIVYLDILRVLATAQEEEKGEPKDGSEQ